MTTTDDTAPPAPDDTASPAGPVPFARGRYALYETPDGGYLLAYRPDDTEADLHLPIPAFIVQMATQAAGATGTDPGALLAQLRGMVGGAG